MTAARGLGSRLTAQKTALDRDMAIQYPGVGAAYVRALATLNGLPRKAAVPIHTLQRRQAGTISSEFRRPDLEGGACGKYSTARRTPEVVENKQGEK